MYVEFTWSKNQGRRDLEHNFCINAFLSWNMINQTHPNNGHMLIVRKYTNGQYHTAEQVAEVICVF